MGRYETKNLSEWGITYETKNQSEWGVMKPKIITAGHYEIKNQSNVFCLQVFYQL